MLSFPQWLTEHGQQFPDLVIAVQLSPHFPQRGRRLIVFLRYAEQHAPHLRSTIKRAHAEWRKARREAEGTK